MSIFIAFSPTYAAAAIFHRFRHRELGLEGLPPIATEKPKTGMAPAHPDEVMRTEILRELALSTARAAQVLGRPCRPLCVLINEKASLSPGMAMRIEPGFKIQAGLLLRLQAPDDSILICSCAG